MTDIKVIGDLINFEWNISDFDPADTETQLLLGFKKDLDSNYIKFNNLKFGYVLKEEGIEIDSQEYPPSGMWYVSTDQEFVESVVLPVSPEKNYTLFIWVNESDNYVEKEISFYKPRYPKPFESWIWQKDEWVAPTPHPDDGNIYVWEEDKLAWVLYDDNLTGTENYIPAHYKTD